MPPGALHDGLHDHRGELVGVPREQRRRSCVRASGAASNAGRRHVREHLRGQHARPQAVHAARRVADRHRLPGVAVVAAAPGAAGGASPGAPASASTAGTSSSRPRPTPSPSRRGTRARSGSGVISTRRVASRTAGSWVSPPNITWLIRAELVAHGRVEHRVGVAVDRRPPRRHAVHQLAHPADRLGEPQPHAGRRLHQERRWRPGIGAYGCQTCARSSASTSWGPTGRPVSRRARAPGTTGVPRSRARRTSSAAGRPAVVRSLPTIMPFTPPTGRGPGRRAAPARGRPHSG